MRVFIFDDTIHSNRLPLDLTRYFQESWELRGFNSYLCAVKLELSLLRMQILKVS